MAAHPTPARLARRRPRIQRDAASRVRTRRARSAGPGRDRLRRADGTASRGHPVARTSAANSRAAKSLRIDAPTWSRRPMRANGGACSAVSRGRVNPPPCCRAICDSDRQPSSRAGPLLRVERLAAHARVGSARARATRNPPVTGGLEGLAATGQGAAASFPHADTRYSPLHGTRDPRLPLSLPHPGRRLAARSQCDPVSSFSSR